MTLSPRSIRTATTAGVLALAYTATTFGALLTPTALEARNAGPYYKAELTQPAAERSTIASGVAWACSETTCVARKASSRPLNVCKKLAREVGPLASFEARGKALAADKLEKCNAR